MKWLVQAGNPPERGGRHHATTTEGASARAVGEAATPCGREAAGDVRAHRPSRARTTGPTLSVLAAFLLVAIHPRHSAGQAQVTTSPAGTTATIIVAHGGDSLWNSYVYDVARNVKSAGEVEVSFLMGPDAATTRFQDVAARLVQNGARRIAVVPLLVSSYSGHFEQIRYLVGENVVLDEMMQHHLHMSGIERPKLSVPIRLSSALDSSPQVAAVLSSRATLLARDASTQALMIVGHGPNSAEHYAAWMRNLRLVADSVRKASGFKDVRVGVVRDDAPAEVRAEAVRGIRELIELQNVATGKEVVVVPILISTGAISRDKLRADLAGLPIVYRGAPLLPHDEIARWVEQRISQLEKSWDD